MQVELIDGRSEQSRGEVIKALTLAFACDPVMRWMYPTPSEYLEHSAGFSLAFGGAAFDAGTAWACTDRSGAALWLPSDVHADGEAIAEYAFSTVEETKHPEMMSLFEKMGAIHPEEPHWYLAIVGVDATQQGRGLGAQLMHGALERCDDEGLIAYLESSNPANISLYQRHGFEVIDEIRVEGVPIVTPMLRPAR